MFVQIMSLAAKFGPASDATEVLHPVNFVNISHVQSGTGRKTFQAKSMPFWKE